MSRKCEICGKGQVSGNRVSHSIPGTMYPIPTDTQEENGMQTFRL